MGSLLTCDWIWFYGTYGFSNIDLFNSTPVFFGEADDISAESSAERFTQVIYFFWMCGT